VCFPQFCVVFFSFGVVGLSFRTQGNNYKIYEHDKGRGRSNNCQWVEVLRVEVLRGAVGARKTEVVVVMAVIVAGSVCWLLICMLFVSFLGLGLLQLGLFYMGHTPRG